MPWTAITESIGSPAHAGIDLDVCGQVLPTARFPRTRGDRPLRNERQFDEIMVPPHTRG